MSAACALTLLLLVHASIGQLILDPGASMLSGTTGENSTLTLSCPSSRVMSKILFASYGMPENLGLAAKYSSCHATISMNVIENYCLKQPFCSVEANNSTE
ncbi:hypothetical protein ACHHYP_06697 [Achlya hypogyna]|uniref:SUEL-type lectin domain-containing protein n=1 Tax=Achlya hypogyna TaxID=1202772 RepID=A0A1V9YS71_ACHHY|nr:hypothetical protein ACHHYP_06697 [Achlya hypogyna]